MKHLFILSLSLLICACSKNQSASDSANGQAFAASDVATAPRSLLQSFYGHFETVSANGVRVERKAEDPTGSIECETSVQIGNANITRISHTADGHVVRNTRVIDAFDPSTKSLIPADEIWLSSGVVTSSLGMKACADSVVALYADRGVWSREGSGLHYHFQDAILKKAIGGTWRTVQLTEDVQLDRLTSGEVRVQVSRSTDEPKELKGDWIIRPL